MMKKTERVYLQKIADLGCIVCKKLGYDGTPAEIHHVKRFGAKRDHTQVIPLCPHHHRTSKESYHLNPLWFSEKFGTQQELLEETMRLVNGKGQN